MNTITSLASRLGGYALACVALLAVCGTIVGVTYIKANAPQVEKQVVVVEKPVEVAAPSGGAKHFKFFHQAVAEFKRRHPETLNNYFETEPKVRPWWIGRVVHSKYLISYSIQTKTYGYCHEKNGYQPYTLYSSNVETLAPLMAQDGLSWTMTKVPVVVLLIATGCGLLLIVVGIREGW